jgi:hypothetical protein
MVFTCLLVPGVSAQAPRQLTGTWLAVLVDSFGESTTGNLAVVTTLLRAKLGTRLLIGL